MCKLTLVRTVEPRYKNLYITKSSVELTVFLIPAIVKCMENNLDLTKPHYSEHILPVPLLFVMSRFHCTIYCYVELPYVALLNLKLSFFVIVCLLSKYVQWIMEGIFCRPYYNGNSR